MSSRNKRTETGMDIDIKELKERDGRGYFRIAKEAGLSPSVVWRVVNGRTRHPSIQTVAKLAAALGVPTGTLIAAMTTEEQKKGKRSEGRAITDQV
jgi:transcriptional regulator with XRE-family HTH domain